MVWLGVSVAQEFRGGLAGFCSLSREAAVQCQLGSSEGLTVAGGPTSKKVCMLLQEASVRPMERDRGGSRSAFCDLALGVTLLQVHSILQVIAVDPIEGAHEDMNPAK